MVDFTTPNLCGANTDFNSLISKFVDIEKILTDNLNVDASALSGLVSPELTTLLTKVRELAPAWPDLPNISLQSQITDLTNIDISTAGGIVKNLNLLANITSNFGDELTVAGYSLSDILSAASTAVSAGGNICAAIPNFELPAAGGTAVEKAAGVLQADVAPETEKPSVLNKNVSVTNAKTAVEAKAATWVNPDDKVIPKKDTGAYTVTKKSRSVAYADDKGESTTVEVVTPADATDGTKRANTSEKGFTTNPGRKTELFYLSDIKKFPASDQWKKWVSEHDDWPGWDNDRHILTLEKSPFNVSGVFGFDPNSIITEQNHKDVGKKGGFNKLLSTRDYVDNKILTKTQIWTQARDKRRDSFSWTGTIDPDKGPTTNQKKYGSNKIIILPAYTQYSSATGDHWVNTKYNEAVYVVVYKYLDTYDPNYKE